MGLCQLRRLKIVSGSWKRGVTLSRSQCRTTQMVTSSRAQSASPIATITTRDRFALVVPAGIDVRFRMLQPSESRGRDGIPQGLPLRWNQDGRGSHDRQRLKLQNRQGTVRLHPGVAHS